MDYFIKICLSIILGGAAFTVLMLAAFITVNVLWCFRFPNNKD